MKSMGIISILLIACAMLCGLWMKFGPGEKDASFHGLLSIGTLVFCLVTIILFMFKR
ncbi:hypothetical protein [Caproicibacterium lactatifermentans]|jgi:Mg2+ and Co2+ transporter CorA|uniref:Exosortase n=1 Tax=Caproicibacterium lactatifermentans TaxID=2666138 RepID=A0A859DWQ7_9FIRM|nr:hypothetical protein [Caproicibacterium lactatifermentans]QKN24411.1 hypothetical protein GJQ69_07905 [Caproicibacterium lactatifermentans]